MQISNSVSFGAILNKTGVDAAHFAKLTAKMYDRMNNNNHCKKTLAKSLDIIRKYKNDEFINIAYEDPHGYDDEGASHSRCHKAILDNKVIYEDFGDEYEFFRNFANAIQKNYLHPRDLTSREIEEGLGQQQNFKPTKKHIFIKNQFQKEFNLNKLC